MGFRWSIPTKRRTKQQYIKHNKDLLVNISLSFSLKFGISFVIFVELNHSFIYLLLKFNNFQLFNSDRFSHFQNITPARIITVTIRTRHFYSPILNKIYFLIAITVSTLYLFPFFEITLLNV